MTDLGAALDDVERTHGSIDAVVLLDVPGASDKGWLADLSPEQWTARVDEPLQMTVAVLREAHRRLADRGRIVVVLPTIAMDGAAAGYVPWATVAEGQRSLVRSAARVWSDAAHTVNAVAVPPGLLVDGAEAERPGLPRPSLAPPTMRDVADVVATVLGDSFAAVTGATIGVDGGRWMSP